MNWELIGLACLSAGVGYVAWRGSKSLFSAILAALILPVIGFIVLGPIVGQTGLHWLGPFGIIVAVGIVIASIAADRAR